MCNGKTAAVATALVMAALLLLAGTDASAQAAKMTKEELKAMLGKPELVVIDVRQEGDLAKSNLKVKGAVRENPKQEVKSWAEKYPKDKTVVLYCA